MSANTLTALLNNVAIFLKNPKRVKAHTCTAYPHDEEVDEALCFCGQVCLVMISHYQILTLNSIWSKRIKFSFFKLSFYYSTPHPWPKKEKVSYSGMFGGGSTRPSLGVPLQSD